MGSGSRPLAGLMKGIDRARQGDADFRELAGPRLYLDRSAMLLDDNVVANGEPQAGPLARRFRREERVEYLLLQIGRNAGAVVPDPDFHTVAEALCRNDKDRLVAIATGFRLAFRRRIKTIRDHVEEGAGDVLRKDFRLACGRIKRPLDGDFETLRLRPRTVPGEVQDFLDNRIDVDTPMLAGDFPRVQQHVLDDRIRTPAVMHDLLEIVL